MEVERRTHRRYPVKSNAFAVLISDPVQLVPIRDISIGGLGVESFDHENQPIKFSKLEILLDDCSFYVDKLPYYLVPRVNAARGNPTEAMACGVRFGTLMPSQISRIKHFIRHHTELDSISSVFLKLYQGLYQFFVNKNSEASCQRYLKSLQKPIL